MAMSKAERLAEETRVSDELTARTAVPEIDRRFALIEQFREQNEIAAQEAFDKGYPVLALSVAPPWMGQPGEILEGTVFAIIPRTHPEYGSYPIVGVKRSTGGLVAVHCLPQTLHDGMKVLAPQAGDPIVVAFMGERLSANRADTEYHLYAVSSPSAATRDYAW